MVGNHRLRRMDGAQRTEEMAKKGKARRSSSAAPANVPTVLIVVRVLLQIDRTRRNDRRNGVLVHHLRHGVLEQHDILIKGFDLPLQLNAIDEIDRIRDMLPALGIEKRVL